MILNLKYFYLWAWLYIYATRLLYATCSSAKTSWRNNFIEIWYRKTSVTTAQKMRFSIKGFLWQNPQESANLVTTWNLKSTWLQWSFYNMFHAFLRFVFRNLIESCFYLFVVASRVLFDTKELFNTVSDLKVHFVIVFDA